MKLTRNGNFTAVDLGRMDVLFFGVAPVAFVDSRHQIAGRLESDMRSGNQALIDEFVTRPAITLERHTQVGLEELILIALSESLGSMRSHKKRRKRRVPQRPPPKPPTPPTCRDEKGKYIPNL